MIKTFNKKTDKDRRKPDEQQINKKRKWTLDTNKHNTEKEIEKVC